MCVFWCMHVCCMSYVAEVIGGHQVFNTITVNSWGRVSHWTWSRWWLESPVILLSPPSNLAGGVGLCDYIWLLRWVPGTGTQDPVLVQQAFLSTENRPSLFSFTIAHKRDLDDYQHREMRNVWAYGYVDLCDLAIHWYMHTQKCHTVIRNLLNYDVSIRNKNIL